MKSLKKTIIMRGVTLLHFAATVGLFVVCWMAFYRYPATQGDYFMHNRTICAAYVLMLFAMSRVYNGYQVGMYRVTDIFYNQALASLVSWGIVYILACIMAQRLLNPLAGVCFFLMQCVVSFGWAMAAVRLYFGLHKPKKTVVIYRNESDLRKLEEITDYQKKWRIALRVQCIDSQNVHDLPYQAEPANGEERHAGMDAHFQEIPKTVVDQNIYRIIDAIRQYETVFVSGVNATLRNGIVKYCVETKKPCFFIPHTGDVIISGATHMKALAVPVCKVERCRPTPEYLLIKRAFDILVSLFAIVLLLPFMAATAAAIKAYDHGPVLYKQVRLTRDGKTFKILKFRSMKVNAEQDGVARLASENDDRITPIGKIIRAIRFDELPQLFNILWGDMSIVGPRPERPEIAKQYEKAFPAFRLRLQVKAGLTGYAQVYGRYNTEPADKLKMDLLYINNIARGYGVAEDLRLMLATVRILLMKESTSGVEKGQTTAMGVGNEEKSA